MNRLLRYWLILGYSVTLTFLLSCGNVKTGEESGEKSDNDYEISKEESNAISEYINLLSTEEKIGQLIVVPFDSSGETKGKIDAELDINEAARYMGVSENAENKEPLRVGNFIITKGVYRNILNTRDIIDYKPFTDNAYEEYKIGEAPSLPFYVAILNNELQKLAESRIPLKLEREEDTNKREPLKPGLDVKKPYSFKLPPLFLLVDQEGGIYEHTTIVDGLPDYPTNMMIAATWLVGVDDDIRAKKALYYSYRKGEMTGRHLSGMGFNMLLGPVADINFENTIIEDRGFGSDPYMAGYLARAFILGVHTGSNNKVLAITKHFPGLDDPTLNPRIDNEYNVDKSKSDYILEDQNTPFDMVADYYSERYYMEGDNGFSGVTDGFLLTYLPYKTSDNRWLSLILYKEPFKEYITDGSSRGLISVEKWRNNNAHLVISDDLTEEVINKEISNMKEVSERFNREYEGLDWESIAAIEALKAGSDLIILNTIDKNKNEEVFSDLVERYGKGDTEFDTRVNEAAKRVITAKYILYGGYDKERGYIYFDYKFISNHNELEDGIESQIIAFHNKDNRIIKEVSSNALSILTPFEKEGKRRTKQDKDFTSRFKASDLIVVYPNDRELDFYGEGATTSIYRIFDDVEFPRGRKLKLSGEDFIWYTKFNPGDENKTIRGPNKLKGKVLKRIDYYLEKGRIPILVIIDTYYPVNVPIDPKNERNGGFQEEEDNRAAVNSLEKLVISLRENDKYECVDIAIISMKYQSWTCKDSTRTGAKNFEELIPDYNLYVLSTYGRTSQCLENGLRLLYDPGWEAKGFYPVSIGPVPYEYTDFVESVMHKVEIKYEHNENNELIGDNLYINISGLDNTGLNIDVMEGYPVYIKIKPEPEKVYKKSLSRLCYFDAKGSVKYPVPIEYIKSEHIEKIVTTVFINNTPVENKDIPIPLLISIPKSKWYWYLIAFLSGTLISFIYPKITKSVKRKWKEIDYFRRYIVVPLGGIIPCVSYFCITKGWEFPDLFNVAIAPYIINILFNVARKCHSWSGVLISLSFTVIFLMLLDFSSNIKVFFDILWKTLKSLTSRSTPPKED